MKSATTRSCVQMRCLKMKEIFTSTVSWWLQFPFLKPGLFSQFGVFLLMLLLDSHTAHCWELLKVQCVPCNGSKIISVPNRPCWECPSTRIPAAEVFPQKYWSPRMSSPIGRTYELSNHSPTPNGLLDLQMVLLPCGLNHFYQAGVQVRPSQSSVSV